MDSGDVNEYQINFYGSGGIGAAHVKEHENGRPLKHLRFIWTIRDLSVIEAMPLLEKKDLGGHVGS